MVTCLVKLMEAKCDAHHDDSESTIVSPSVAGWSWRKQTQTLIFGNKLQHIAYNI